jgi:hypothetical protein
MKRCIALMLTLAFVGIYASAAQSKFPCRNWLRLTEPQKTGLIGALIKRAGEDKVNISLPTEYYVEALDTLIKRYADTENEKALDASLGLTFHTIAAMEGDWDNGEDPVEHARKLMGEELFEAFKKMYPEKYKNLLEKSRKKGESQKKSEG